MYYGSLSIQLRMIWLITCKPKARDVLRLSEKMCARPLCSPNYTIVRSVIAQVLRTLLKQTRCKSESKQFVCPVNDGSTPTRADLIEMEHITHSTSDWPVSVLHLRLPKLPRQMPTCNTAQRALRPTIDCCRSFVELQERGTKYWKVFGLQLRKWPASTIARTAQVFDVPIENHQWAHLKQPKTIVLNTDLWAFYRLTRETTSKAFQFKFECARVAWCAEHLFRRIMLNASTYVAIKRIKTILA